VNSSSLVEIDCTLNGSPFKKKIRPNQTLCDFIHDEVGLTGMKKGCDTGECGACTVLLDGKPVTSCLVLAPQVDGREVVTIEGLGSETSPHPIQKALVELDGVQCGYCIPGMVLTLSWLLQELPGLSDQEIKHRISGNLCRCGGYHQQVEAVKLAYEKSSTRGCA
jgi:aerobic-type carbon monoxide dehydrogenase small subunit (CoxS/CutS family)